MKWKIINNLYSIIMFIYINLIDKYSRISLRAKFAEWFRRGFVTPIYFKKHYDINIFPFEIYSGKEVIL